MRKRLDVFKADIIACVCVYIYTHTHTLLYYAIILYYYNTVYIYTHYTHTHTRAQHTSVQDIRTNKRTYVIYVSAASIILGYGGAAVATVAAHNSPCRSILEVGPPTTLPFQPISLSYVHTYISVTDVYI